MLLDRANRVATPGHERARVLAQAAGLETSPRDAVALYRKALADARGDTALEATIHLRLAPLMRFSDGVAQGLEHATLAVRAATEAGDDAVRCQALSAYGLLHFNAGLGVPETEMAEGLALERSLTERPPGDAGEMPSLTMAHQLFWSGALDRARAHLEQLLAGLAGRQEPLLESDVIAFLGYVEWRAGNWEEADRLAAAYRDLLDQLGQMHPFAVLQAALIAAHRGRIDEARTWALEGVARGKEEGTRITVASLSGVLGFVELSLQNHDAALEYLRPAHELRNDFLLEPGMRLELGDTLEALIACGELGEAEAILAAWESRARRLDRAGALAILGRCRGLLPGGSW